MKSKHDMAVISGHKTFPGADNVFSCRSRAACFRPSNGNSKRLMCFARPFATNAECFSHSKRRCIGMCIGRALGASRVASGSAAIAEDRNNTCFHVNCNRRRGICHPSATDFNCNAIDPTAAERWCACERENENSKLGESKTATTHATRQSIVK